MMADGRVFTGADDDVTIRVWGANNVSATNCVWSQKIAGIENPWKLMFPRFRGAPRGIRTHNPRLKRTLL